METINKWSYIGKVLVFFLYVVIYFVVFAIVVPKLLSAASTLSFFAGIAISVAFVAFAIYKLGKWFIKIS